MLHNSRRKLPTPAGLALAAWLGAFLATDGLAQDWRPLTFTVAESQDGSRTFHTFCASCHGIALQGASGPPLRGVSFRWLGQPVGALLAFVAAAMPADNPGTLSARQYREVIAFLAFANGGVPGTEPMPAEPGALNTMTLGP